MDNMVVALVVFGVILLVLINESEQKAEKKRAFEIAEAERGYRGCFKAGGMDYMAYNGIPSSTPNIVKNCKEIGRQMGFKYISISDYEPHQNVGVCRGAFFPNVLETMPHSDNWWIDPDKNKVGGFGTDCVYDSAM